MADGAYRRTYRIQHWPTWDDELNAFVRDFEAAFKIPPDRMIASPQAYARLDLVANRKKARLHHSSDGRTAGPEEFAVVSGFTGDGYELEFLLDERVQKDALVLTFGGDPSGGGKPIPEEDTPAIATHARVRRRKAG